MTHDPATQLEHVLTEENAALRAMDLKRAVGLLHEKAGALAAFAGAKPSEPILRRIKAAAEANAKLLEQAIKVQARVIRIVAKASAPKPRGYSASGAAALPRCRAALCVCDRMHRVGCVRPQRASDGSLHTFHQPIGEPAVFPDAMTLVARIHPLYSGDGIHMEHAVGNLATRAGLLLAMTVGAYAAHAATVRPYQRPLFEAAQKSGAPILIFVEAPWCPTCAKERPILQRLYETPEFGTLQVFDVDFDTSKPLLRRLGVQQQSTLIVYHGDKETARLTGATDPAVIKRLLETSAD